MFIFNHWFVQKKVHKITLKYLSEFSFKTGTPFNTIAPDIKGKAHGYSINQHSGNLTDMIKEQYYSVLNKARRGLPVDKEVCWLIHYITDAMTIGQISGEKLWGTKDDAIDFFSDLVLNKTSTNPISCYAVSGYMEFNSKLLDEMLKIYVCWIRSAQKWTSGFWLFNMRVGNYTRSSLRKAIQLSCIALCTIDREISRNV